MRKDEGEICSKAASLTSPPFSPVWRYPCQQIRACWSSPVEHKSSQGFGRAVEQTAKSREDGRRVRGQWKVDELLGVIENHGVLHGLQ